jgi:hypothetical protein
MHRLLNRIFLLLVFTLHAMAGAPSVWVSSPWEHVLKSSPPGTIREAKLQASANEYESFRIVVRADDAPLTGLTLVSSALRGSAGEIPASRLTFYREHYLSLATTTLRSQAPTGWYPDALIPFLDPATGRPPLGGKYRADLVSIEPNSNQGYWVDVHVPKGTRAGEYVGTITVKANGTLLAVVPLHVVVWPFELPDTIALASNFGDLRRIATYYHLDPNSPEFAEVENQYIDTLLAHRAVPGSLGNVWPTIRPDGTVDDSQTGARLRQLIEERHVNALRIPFSGISDPDKARRQLRAYANYLRRNGWLDLAFVYMKDEPNDADAYDLVRRQGALIHEADPGIKRMVTEQTLTSDPAWGNLYGAVDIWCPLWGLWDEKTARERVAVGEKLWSYTALVQRQAPFWAIDFAPVNFRAPFWISWQYGIEGFLYWSSVHWNYEDVWNKPHFRGKYWGEGLLVYPGIEAGMKGPVPTIRLKLIRDGIEDYEYMALAAKRGRKLEVDAIVARLACSFQDWEKDPAAYASARAALAQLNLNSAIGPTTDKR